MKRSLTLLPFFICSWPLLAIFGSCRKFLDIVPSPTLVENAAVFRSEQTAMAAVSGLYSQLVATNLSLTNGGGSVYPALAADEVVSLTNAQYQPFYQNSLSATHTALQTLWSGAYRALYSANALLEGLEASTSIPMDLRQRLSGEVLTIRALLLFYLVQYFGPVPLVTGTDYSINAQLPRADREAVYQQVVADLEAAREQLPANYPSVGRVRINRWAAEALLARVYLYLDQPEQAEAHARNVIESGFYELEADLNRVFLSDSPEALWQLMRERNNTAEATTFIPFSAGSIPVLSVSTYLLSAFEPGDRRKEQWLKKNTVDGQDYYFPYKYKVRSGSVVTEYLVVLRFSEVLLIRAEAAARQQQLTEALADLNAVRQRAGLPDAAPADQTALLEAIYHERQVELFTEWGHRWQDLQRSGQLGAVLGSRKADWQATDALWPLPQEEILKNPALTQNPGY